MTYVTNPSLDAYTNSERTQEINPLSTHYNEQTLIDVTNGIDGTYNYYIDMTTFRKVGFQLELSGGSGSVTVTIEGTIQADGTAPSSCTYQDITNDTFGSVSFTASDMLIDNAEKLSCFKYIKVKVVADTSGSNDADWTIYYKQLY